MSKFVFNNYVDFGIFLKVNSEDMLQEVNQDIHESIKSLLNLYENSKGGCGCNIKKRIEAAKNAYINTIPVIFSDSEAISFTKGVLGCEENTFNQQPDNMDILTI